MRLDDWRTRLSDTIERYRTSPMEYGRAECAVFAADCVAAVTGERPGRKSWFKYRTEAGALSVMKRAGFDDLASMVASVLPEHHISECTVGDVAALPAPDSAFGWALGVVSGERIFVFSDTNLGLGTVDLLTPGARGFWVR